MIRFDNGTEYIRATLKDRVIKRGIRFESIEPGTPQQIAYVERFNRTVRYE